MKQEGNELIIPENLQKKNNTVNILILAQQAQFRLSISIILNEINLVCLKSLIVC